MSTRAPSSTSEAQTLCIGKALPARNAPLIKAHNLNEDEKAPNRVDDMDYDDNGYLIINAQDDDDVEHNTVEISVDTTSTRSRHDIDKDFTSCRSQHWWCDGGWSCRIGHGRGQCPNSRQRWHHRPQQRQAANPCSKRRKMRKIKHHYIVLSRPQLNRNEHCPRVIFSSYNPRAVMQQKIKIIRAITLRSQLTLVR